MMSEEEKKQAQNILRAFELLPIDERKYLIGYADGVIASRPPVQTSAQVIPSADWARI